MLPYMIVYDLVGNPTAHVIPNDSDNHLPHIAVLLGLLIHPILLQTSITIIYDDHFSIGKSTINGPFSIAMFAYKRVMGYTGLYIAVVLAQVSHL